MRRALIRAWAGAGSRDAGSSAAHAGPDGLDHLVREILPADERDGRGTGDDLVLALGAQLGEQLVHLEAAGLGVRRPGSVAAVLVEGGGGEDDERLLPHRLERLDLLETAGQSPEFPG